MIRLKKNVAISEDGLVFNPVTGESFSVNPIGGEMLGMIKGGKDPKEISSSILKRYNTDESTFEKDFSDFLEILTHHNLLEKDETKKA
jgi:hypothetical protein